MPFARDSFHLNSTLAARHCRLLRPPVRQTNHLTFVHVNDGCWAYAVHVSIFFVSERK
jgi:hypothetical protein